eukprot:CAMPEP_0198737402 /NCGR_PEP_ID=MMETSP1475-20131203/67849_1 /TAXON_ID= ORGANISM="Unidentified sp., Strain CCMP1999" /NCGR_SAMPLE_ID=MMETSP1475 /ASSEMBLY_ACC=CAM_ASM_001111 /LENGTH=158 /DNA_ID=CAMNT_0044501265 /DNA_START=34 /DNA_END=513 /DNA_ORIENTATION=-
MPRRKEETEATTSQSRGETEKSNESAPESKGTEDTPAGGRRSQTRSSAAKRQERHIPGGSRRKKRRQTYHKYVYRMLKQVHPDLRMTPEAYEIMHSFSVDIFQRVCREAQELTTYRNSKTLHLHDIQSAVKLLLPGELAPHAIQEGLKSVLRYKRSKK